MKKINKKTLTVSLAIIAAVCVIFGIVLLLASPKSGGSANIANGSFEGVGIHILFKRYFRVKRGCREGCCARQCREAHECGA